MDIMSILKQKIRPVELFDEIDYEMFSHSKLECFGNCPYQYKFKHEDKLVDDSTTIALQLGRLTHYILEEKFKMLVAGHEVDYAHLNDLLLNGVHIHDEKTKEDLIGLSEIRDIYADIWNEPDSEGRDYNTKIKIFDTVLHNEMEDMGEWKPYKAEHHFKFVYDDKYIIQGFIDRLDINKNGDIRTVDYKTTKKHYMDNKVATSQQFGIYALAVLNEFDKIPIESIYRFIFLDSEQYALTKGWENRLIKKLDKIFESIEQCKANNIWKPSPTPLCHYCSYCRTNPNASIQKCRCDYYSLWQPDNKTFEVNKKWTEEDAIKINTLSGRKLIF